MLALPSVSLVLLIFVFNRAASKISLGPIYLFDILVLANFFVVVSYLYKFRGKYIQFVLMMGFSISWLMYELFSGEFSDNNIRRFAMSVYMVIPVIIFIYGEKLYRIIFDNSMIIAIMVSVSAVVISGEDIRPTLSALVLSFLFVAEYYRKKNRCN